MELLAPAGSRDSLVAAVQAGANAIYLGGKSFGARHYASNFSMEELREVIQYCHLRNVSIYVTVNTLIHDRELIDLASYLEELGKMKIDGIIVQDLAVAKIARKVAPQIEIHGSTQMTVHNAASAIALEKLGFSRIVLARELTLEEIRIICQSTQLEVEIFVHGALCIAYSGQCLLSSMIGGRSGNRGKCAQPCRLPYQLECNGKKVVLPEGNHLLSPKDLNFIDYLDEFKEMGIASLKIEGRMKSPEYVATVVNSYRDALDKASGEKPSSEKLYKVFNRGYSNGYLQNLSGKKMIATEKPNNQGEMIGYTEVIGKRNQIKLNTSIYPGDQLEILLENNEKRVIEVSQEYDQYIVLEGSLKILKVAKDFNKKMILKFPRILQEEDYDVYLQAVKSNQLAAFDGVCLSNLALLDEIKKQYPQMTVYGDFSLNIFNHISLEEYLDLGFDEVTLSPELTMKEVRELSQVVGDKIQIFVHGFQEVMVSKFCMIGSYLGNVSEDSKCSRPCLKGSYTLRDRKDEQFTIATDENCRMHIYNGKELSMLSSTRELLSLQVSTWKIDGRWIENESLFRIIEEYNQGILSEKNIPKDQEKDIVAGQLTRGHYFRGVE